MSALAALKTIANLAFTVLAAVAAILGVLELSHAYLGLAPFGGNMVLATVSLAGATAVNFSLAKGMWNLPLRPSQRGRHG